MAIKKRPVSPRQKMINLMYVVLMAMLALNVSTEVLNGFSIVEEGLRRSTTNTAKENNAIYEALDLQMQANPAKTRPWFEKAQQVRRMSDSLYNLAMDLKEAIVKEADGEEGDVKNIINRESLEAANQVMLAPGRGRGQELCDAINSFRTRITEMITDRKQKAIINNNFSTQPPADAMTMGKNWQEYMFEDMPVAAAVTLLTKLQNDVRYAEGEVLHNLAKNVDVKDIRVNQLNAYVIPNAQTIVSGGQFQARIVMAAIDTTQQPRIFIGGREVQLRDNMYSVTTSKTGDFTLSGYITMENGDGEEVRRDFSQKYTVVAPSATVSADLMNMLYAGYNNPISVSVPGVPLNQVSASISGGSLQQTGPGKYIAKPAKVGQDVKISVISNAHGRAQTMGEFTFRVRKLPDPTPYITFGTNRYKGGALSKQQLMEVSTLSAAIDDGLLDIPFKVQSFETVFFDNMGNAVPQASDGANFSTRQKELFRKLSRNKRFYISRVKAIGPDGISRQLNTAMEVIVK